MIIALHIPPPGVRFIFNKLSHSTFAAVALPTVQIAGEGY